ncbi:MAG: hypothetical protein R6X12_05730 [bacterium]
MAEIRLLPEWTVATLAGSGGRDSVERALFRVVRWLSAAGLPMVGKPFVSFPVRAQDSPDSAGFFVAVPVPAGATAAESTGIAVRSWGGFRVAAAVHTGPRDGLEAARERLRDWAEANGWEVAGGAMEFFLDLPGQAHADSARIEVALPVRKVESR